MTGVYDPNEGVESSIGGTGFQNYQGSLREELIDGELRCFRTYIGPSITRRDFLQRIFGLSFATYHPTTHAIQCLKTCGFPLRYPNPAFTCALTAVTPEIVLIPFAFRTVPADADYADYVESEIGLDPSIMPQQDCLVLIEIEYRQALEVWPPELHDFTYNAGGFKDVPTITAPRYFWYTADPSLEMRELKNSNFGIWSTGSVTPSTAAGPGSNNQIDPEELKPVAAVNVNEFKITVYNCPRVNYSVLNQGHGKVNDRVWFGYPRGAVCFTDYEVRLRATFANTLQYDVDYTFMAKTVPARGETVGMVTPTGTEFVYPNSGTTGRVGVWNRVYWPYPITGTNQYFWPFIDVQKAKHVSAGVSTDLEFNLFAEFSFLSLFDATALALCP